MPIVADGLVTGEPLGGRPVYVHEVKIRQFQTFTRHWRRTCPTFSKSQGSIRESRTDSSETTDAPNESTNTAPGADGEISGDHAYAAFYLPNRKVIVLSTFQVPGTDLVAVLNDVDRVRDAVVWLGLSTYRVDHDDDTGVRVVLGKTSSSRGLYLDPARISKMAAGSSWVAVATHVDPVAVAEALKAREVEVREQAESVKSVGSVSFEVAVDVARRAGGHVRVEAPVGDVVIDDIDLTDLFQEAG